MLARIAFETGSLEEARLNCDTAIQKVATLEAPLLKYHANLFLGHIQRSVSEISLAHASYSRARVELETLRGRLQGEELKIAFLKNKLDVYESLVQLCLHKNSNAAHEEAFEYMEQAKSRSLADLLSQNGPEPDGLRDERLLALRGELNWYYHRIEIEQTRSEGISLELIQRLRAEACSKENEFLHALRTLPGRSETSDVLLAAGAMTLQQIQGVLPSDATLLEYFQIGSQFVAAVVTREDLKIVPLAASSSQVTGQVRMLEFQLSKFRLKNSYSKIPVGPARRNRKPVARTISGSGGPLSSGAEKAVT